MGWGQKTHRDRLRQSLAQWHGSEIPATLEVEASVLQVQGQPGLQKKFKSSLSILVRTYFIKQMGIWLSLVDRLSSTHKGLSLIPRTTPRIRQGGAGL